MRPRHRWIPLLLLVAALARGAPAAPQESEQEATSGDRTILGAPPAFDLGSDRELVRLEAETALHQQPAGRSPVLIRLDFAAELPVLERRGGWVKVRSGGLVGWTPVDPGVEPPPSPLELRLTLGGPDPAAVERARRHLPAATVARPLGPYVLYTDVDDERRLAELARLAAELPTLFHRRFGLEAVPVDGETVVLFAREKTYRAYIESIADPMLLDSAGSASARLAVLYAGDRLPGELRSVLVHEIAHLLTYRTLGHDLPSWLAEGLAEDLAYCRVSRSGELVLGSLDTWRASRALPAIDRGGRVTMGVETRTNGPRLALDRLRQEWSRPWRPALAQFLAFSELEFLAPERRSLHYGMSAFWVRYLLADDPPSAGERKAPRRDAFRSFLAAMARGEAVGAVALGRRLGTSWQELEAAWGKWLRGRGPWKEER